MIVRNRGLERTLRLVVYTYAMFVVAIMAMLWIWLEMSINRLRRGVDWKESMFWYCAAIGFTQVALTLVVTVFVGSHHAARRRR